MRAAGLLFIILFLSSALAAETPIILKQDGSPIEIVEYKVDMYRRSETDKGIEITLVLKNVSSSKIGVARFREITFNSFNEYSCSSVGLISNNWKGIRPGEVVKHEAANVNLASDFIAKYGTGFVFIEAIRFEDGKIWKADWDDIVSQIKEVFEDFSADMITKTKEK